MNSLLKHSVNFLNKHKKVLSKLSITYLTINIITCFFIETFEQTTTLFENVIKRMPLFRPLFNLPFVAEAILWHIFVSVVLLIVFKINRQNYEKLSFIKNATTLLSMLILRMVINIVFIPFSLVIKFSLPYSLISVVLSLFWGLGVSLTESSSTTTK